VNRDSQQQITEPEKNIVCSNKKQPEDGGHTHMTTLNIAKMFTQTWKNYFGRAGEMAQHVRAVTVLLKVLSSNSSNHMVAHNHP
jgi:DNA repair protein RadC